VEFNLAMRSCLDLLRGQAVENRSRRLTQPFLIGSERHEDLPGDMIPLAARQQIRRVDVDFKFCAASKTGTYVLRVDRIGRNPRPNPDFGGVERTMGGGVNLPRHFPEVESRGSETVR